MKDAQCIDFLQAALPRLGMRWRGFRKVRRQVCKRIMRRYRALGLADIDAYRARLDNDPGEWRILDSLCRIPISRFLRDRATFDALCEQVLPRLARHAIALGDGAVRCWSAGCASGEEPYTLGLAWRFRIALGYPNARLHIIATDADAHLLARAEQACYPAGCLRELPSEWVASVFEHRGRQLCLRPEYRTGIAFLQQDIRTEMPDGPFDLVLCRNLAFTYFEDRIQKNVLHRIADRTSERGYLVIGAHESLPAGVTEFAAENLPRAVFRRVPGADATETGVPSAQTTLRPDTADRI